MCSLKPMQVYSKSLQSVGAQLIKGNARLTAPQTVQLTNGQTLKVLLFPVLLLSDLLRQMVILHAATATKQLYKPVASCYLSCSHDASILLTPGAQDPDCHWHPADASFLSRQSAVQHE